MLNNSLVILFLSIFTIFPMCGVLLTLLLWKVLSTHYDTAGKVFVSLGTVHRLETVLEQSIFVCNVYGRHDGKLRLLCEMNGVTISYLTGRKEMDVCNLDSTTRKAFDKFRTWSHR